MDCFLRFTSKNHRDARTNELLHQIPKRAVITVILFIIYFIGGLIILFAATPILPMNSKTFFSGRIGVTGCYVVVIWILKFKASRLQRYIHVINLILDLLALIGCISLYPYTSNVHIDSFTTIGLIIYVWSTNSLFFCLMTLMTNWWVRILGILFQIIFFLAFGLQTEVHIIPILVFGIEAMLFYIFTVYVVEKYERARFVELLKIQENLEAINKIFENLTEGIAIFDKDFHVLYTNKAVSTLFNVQSPSSIEQIFDKVKIKAIAPPIENILTEPRFDHSQVSSDYLLSNHLNEIICHLFAPLEKHKTENIMTIEAHTQLTENEITTKKNYLIKLNSTLYMNKRVIVANINDMTDRDALIAAEDSNNYKSRLLASVSHELRTPLNGSINFTEQAILDPTVPEKIKLKWLVPALRSNRLLLSLINDILDFSQIQENKLRLVFDLEDIGTTARECIELLEIQAEKKGIELVLHNMLSKEEALVCTDHNRLRQIILNLLSNAVKFTFQGSVALKLEAITAGDDQAPSYHPKEKAIRISCQDTGIGISEENQKKLFQAFEKIELGDKNVLNSTGVGLGLVISNNLVHRLNSTGNSALHEETQSIKFTSKVDEGSCFYFDLYEKKETKTKRANSIVNLPDISLGSCPRLDVSLDQGGISAIELRRDIFSWVATPEQMSLQNHSERSNLLYRSRLHGRTRVGEESPMPLIQKPCVCPKILIVDDDPFNLTALEQHITRLQLSCEWAFNGNSAVEKIRKRQSSKCSNSCSQYVAVFMDCNMPVMNGFEATAMLRKLIRKGEIEDLKIIACTALVQQSDLDQAKLAGMDDYCTKPISYAMVKEKLASIEALKLR